MFGEKKPKKVEKVLDKAKKDDSDSGGFFRQKTSENTLSRGGVKIE